MHYKLVAQRQDVIAYFCMEYALSERLADGVSFHKAPPIYSGGLGVLAGDILKAAADEGLPMVGVGLSYQDGYFEQGFDTAGRQTATPQPWDPDQMENLAIINGEDGKPLKGFIKYFDAEFSKQEIKVWYQVRRYDVAGKKGTVPLYLLDTKIEENQQFAKGILDKLYGEIDKAGCWQRMVQEMLLGIGGRDVLEQLNYNVRDLHVNEGHAAFAFMRDHEIQNNTLRDVKPEELTRKGKTQRIFTTHTIVAAGHQQFSLDKLQNVMKPYYDWITFVLEYGIRNGSVNMTKLSQWFADSIFGVAALHAALCREVLPSPNDESKMDDRVTAVVNGVHLGTWMSNPVKQLLNRFVGDNWYGDQTTIRDVYAHRSERPAQETLWTAHTDNKKALLAFVKEHNRIDLDPKMLTIGFARRAAPYKRADLIFEDIERLKAIAKQAGGIQLIFAGKSHPHDGAGIDILQNLHKVMSNEELKAAGITIVFIDNYSMQVGALMTAGVDIWLNNPQPPLEASGTSGQKAAANGVLNLSTCDGWWFEEKSSGRGGWTIGSAPYPPYAQKMSLPLRNTQDANALYFVLEQSVIPQWREAVDSHDMPGSEWVQKMFASLAFNASHFNAQRMVRDYARDHYGMEPPANESASWTWKEAA